MTPPISYESVVSHWPEPLRCWTWKSGEVDPCVRMRPELKCLGQGGHMTERQGTKAKVLSQGTSRAMLGHKV